jgi:hypothetical protein
MTQLSITKKFSEPQRGVEVRQYGKLIRLLLIEQRFQNYEHIEFQPLEIIQLKKL